MTVAAAVAIPSGTPAAAALVRTLATKARDKDGRVAAAALELLVQLPVQVMADCLSAVAWKELLVAGLHAACGSGKGPIRAGRKAAGAADAQLSDDGCKAITGMLSELLQWRGCGDSMGPAAAAGGGGTALGGLAASRRTLLLLLHDPLLESLWDQLAGQMQSEVAATAAASVQQPRRRQGKRGRMSVRFSDDEWESDGSDSGGERSSGSESSGEETACDDSCTASGEDGAEEMSGDERLSGPPEQQQQQQQQQQQEGAGSAEATAAEMILAGFEEELALEMEVDE